MLQKNQILYFLSIVIMLAALPTKAQKTLIIGIDGCRADVALSANTPNLDLLSANGISSMDALNDDITISGPGWSAIVCGVYSPKHLVTGNDFTINNYAQYPSIFKRVEAYDSTLNTVSIVHWNPINDHIILNDADLTINVASDIDVANQAINVLGNSDPDIMFLHFDEADGAGHGYGFAANIPQYVSTIENIDNLIGSVLTALQNRPNYNTENWAVMVTSDHGGINFSHGGNTFYEENVPFIISGDSIDFEQIFKDSTLDITYNCLNDTLVLDFDGDDDHVTIPNNSVFDFGANQDFTIECRVKTNNAADVAIVGNKNWDSGLNKGFVFSFRYPSGPEWKVNIGDGTNRADLNIGGSIADEEWHTLSVSFDRDGVMKMYENGAFIGETDISFINDINTFSGIFLGTDINNGYDFAGNIAELRIWNKVIPGVEISDWYCTRIDNTHPSHPNLIGYWKMDQDQNNGMINDASGNNNHAFINNATWLQTDSMWIYDYSNTPRIADIPISALSHMCIPIEQAWGLDGKSWVPDCIYDDRDCSNPGSNIWIGPSNGYWNDDQNWSKGYIPKICDNVIVPTGSTLKLQTGKSGECNTLDVEAGAELDLETGAIFIASGQSQ